MGKIGIAATKYIIRAKLKAEGIVEKPDIIGAIFGQTEGLLGEELELRELQKSGRIGRIEVTADSKEGKSEGSIEIPTSLTKEDTALIAAALETIERVGPCDAHIEVLSIDDVRTTKRDYVVDRAKALINEISKETPESQELSELVKEKVRVTEIIEYGEDKLPAGPDMAGAEEIIVVEGRADVVTLLKYGITNVIGLSGTSIPKSIKELCSQKTVTVFLDGDRGGDLILKELVQLAEIDFVARAPVGREVEELTQKEIIKALRNKITKEDALRAMEDRHMHAPEQRERHATAATSAPAGTIKPLERSHLYRGRRESGYERRESSYGRRGGRYDRDESSYGRPTLAAPKKFEFGDEFNSLSKLSISIMDSGNASLLKQSGNNFREVGKIPKSDINDVLKNLQAGSAQALIIDGEADQSLVNEASAKGIKYLICARKPRYLRRKPGMYVLDATFLRRGIEEKESSAAAKKTTKSE